MTERDDLKSDDSTLLLFAFKLWVATMVVVIANGILFLNLMRETNRKLGDIQYSIGYLAQTQGQSTP